MGEEEGGGFPVCFASFPASSHTHTHAQKTQRLRALRQNRNRHCSIKCVCVCVGGHAVTWTPYLEVKVPATQKPGADSTMKKEKKHTHRHTHLQRRRRGEGPRVPTRERRILFLLLLSDGQSEQRPYRYRVFLYACVHYVRRVSQLSADDSVWAGDATGLFCCGCRR